MLIASEWQELQQMSSPFTAVACNARDPLMRTFMSTDSLAGVHLWLHPPAGNIAAALAQYSRLKAKSPQLTSACILLPKWLGQRWRSKLQGMRLLKTYEKGQQLFTAEAAAAGKARWQMEVWYDPPVPQLHLGAVMRQALTMQFNGTLAGNLAAKLLIDSGASDVFVTSAACRQAGITVRPAIGAAAGVSLGDGQADAKVVGSCVLPLRIQGYKGKVKALVLESLLEGFDVILGDSWLSQNAVIINYRTQKCELKQGMKYIRLTPGELTPPAQAAAAAPPRSADVSAAATQPATRGPHRLLSAMQAKKEVRGAGKKGDHVFLVMVKPAAEQQLTTTDPAATRASMGPDPKLVPAHLMEQLLRQYDDVMPAELPSGLPPERDIGHAIPLLPGDHRPPSRPLYRLSPLEMERRCASRWRRCWKRG